MIDMALKEWRLVCDLLLDGRLALLLRKGGIHEGSGPGEFEVEHEKFGLYPTFDHQDARMLKVPFAGELVKDDDPGRVVIDGFAEVARVWSVPSRGAFEKLDDLHPWSEAYLDMRFGYRPDRPLYLMAVRAWRLHEPRVLAYRAMFAGCKSWVPLDANEAIDESGATPALSDEAISRLIDRVNDAMR